MAEQAASENAAHIQMLLQDSARLAEMAATVSSVDAVLSLQTISDTNDGASCFDGSNIGIDLKLQSELDTLTFWNPSLGATVSRQADGSIHLNFRLSPTESGFAKAVNLRELSAIKTLSLNLAEELRSAGLAIPLSDSVGSVSLELRVNGTTVLFLDKMEPCQGQLSQGQVVYCMGDVFAKIPMEYRRVIATGSTIQHEETLATANPPLSRPPQCDAPTLPVDTSRVASSAFERESEVVWFEGNYSAYIKDLKKRKGADADQPHRTRYKTLVRS